MEVSECPCCGGYPVRLGCLGNTAWFRCRQCGSEFFAPVVVDEAAIAADGEDE